MSVPMECARPVVSDGEFNRLLGLPAGMLPGDEIEDRKRWVREWYEQNGRPWTAVSPPLNVRVDTGGVWIEERYFASVFLADKFRHVGVDSLVIVVASAGPQAESEAALRWKQEEPDLYYFLEVYASAVVQALLAQVGFRLCGDYESNARNVITPYSPGFDGWDLRDQLELLDLAKSVMGEALGPIQALDSGALRPKKSEIAVFGLTGRKVDNGLSTSYVPCTECALIACQYRKREYVHHHFHALAETPENSIDQKPSYAFAPRVLRRWAKDRLILEEDGPRQVKATFRFDGSTCSNMGRPLSFVFCAVLMEVSGEWKICSMQVRPAEEDQGHREMCGYLGRKALFLNEIEHEVILVGEPLASALDWNRDIAPSGCLCSQGNRNHKWRIVLQTIHFALSQQTQHPSN